MDIESNAPPFELTAEEARVLGCLLEKSYTPDVYRLASTVC